ncbi:MAG: hypothetical protein ACP5N3_05095 [Candidatus Nanoarchaeia archaeon]
MAQATLDLEQYLERDIIEFLDSQKELQETTEKSSASDMLSALEINNVALASKLLEDAVQNYNKISANNIYKEIFFKKILEMYRQAKSFTTMHPQPSKLKEYVDLLTHSAELELGPPEKITAFEEKINKKEEARIRAQEKEVEFAAALLEKINKIKENLSISIRKKNLKETIDNYKELKEYFEQYPSTDLDKKQEIYNDILSYFMQINKLRKEIEEEKTKSLKEKAKFQTATKLSNNKYLRLDDIKLKINGIKEDVKNSDFNAATQKTMELKQITSKIPDQYKHIRSILNSKIDIIIQRIEFVKRVKKHN